MGYASRLLSRNVRRAAADSPDDPVVAVLDQTIRVLSKRGVRFDPKDEDAFQEAVLALIKARESFDPSHGVPWGAYAAMKVAYGYREFLRGRKSKFKRESVSVGSSLEVESLAGLAVGFEESGYREADVRDLIGEAIRELPPVWRDVVCLRHGLPTRSGETLEPRKFREIGEIYGNCESWASGIYARAIRRLRVNLEAEEVA